MFDVNGDSSIDSTDTSFLVQTILGTSWGDSDLDGDVDTIDLTLAIINFTGAKSSVSTALRSPGPWTIVASSLKGSAQPNLPAISVVEADREEPTHAPAATNDSLRDLPRSLASSSPAAKRPTSQVDRLPQLDDRQ